jgi:hypothetical protein
MAGGRDLVAIDGEQKGEQQQSGVRAMQRTHEGLVSLRGQRVFDEASRDAVAGEAMSRVPPSAYRRLCTR